jgi:hypothetical protein
MDGRGIMKRSLLRKDQGESLLRKAARFFSIPMIRRINANSSDGNIQRPGNFTCLIWFLTAYAGCRKTQKLLISKIHLSSRKQGSINF